MEIKNKHFQCRDCNKFYPDLLGAVNCGCISSPKKKVKWTNPPVLRKNVFKRIKNYFSDIELVNMKVGSSN
jgi:hypothetical protein